MFSGLNPRRSQANAEAARRRVKETTFTQPLGIEAARSDADMQALRTFLREFYPTFYNKYSKLARQNVLVQYEEVASFAEKLIPKEVSEEEFWQRYYFRCEPHRILLEWDRNPERGRQVMGEAMTNWFDSKIDSVKKIFSEEDEKNKVAGSYKNALTNGVADVSTKTVTAEKKNRGDVTEKVADAKKSFAPASPPYVPPHKRGTVQVAEKKAPTHDRGKPLSLRSISNNRTKKENNKATSVNGPKNNVRLETLGGSRATKSEVKKEAPVQGDTKSIVPGTENAKPKPDSVGTKKTMEISAKVPPDQSRKAYGANNSVLLVFVVCCPCCVFLLFFRKEQICNSVHVDTPWWSSICPEAPPVEMNNYGTKKKKKLVGKKKTMGPSSAALDGYQDDSSSSLLDNNNGNLAPFGSDNNSGGLVENLISSWMQNTDMAQMMGGMEQQFENALTPSLPSYQQEPPQKKRQKGLVQFFKRRFGRDRQDINHNALATTNNYNYNPAVVTPHQPQMVVHQHIHHVVHHVVHEYKD
mmetsp:Transcript_8115/g.14222  ORF Transcript_8115/g.14222 Transcript_8115/m.14222 type:complete len:526 (+) Transcript_8115:59-1636(+)